MFEKSVKDVFYLSLCFLKSKLMAFLSSILSDYINLADAFIQDELQVRNSLNSLTYGLEVGIKPAAV